MLLNLLRDHQPDRIAVAFDRPEPTFRHERVETYKANRDAAPDILRQQMGLVRQVVDALAHPGRSSRPASRPTTSSPRWPPQAAATGDDVIDRHRRPRQPTSSSRTRTSRCSTTSAACQRLRAVRRGRHRGAHRRAARRSYVAVRGAAGRPVRQPARRARGGGEDGGQADQHLRRPRRHLRARRRADAEAAGRTSPSTRPRPARTPRSWCCVRDVAARRRSRRRWSMGDVDVEEVRKLFEFLEFRNETATSAWPRCSTTELGTGGSRGRRARCSRPSVTELGRRGRARSSCSWRWRDRRRRRWRSRRRWVGRPRALAARGPGLRGRRGDAAEVAFAARRRCSTTAGRRRARATWSAPAAARRRATAPSRSCAALLPHGLDVAPPRARHRCSPRTCSIRPRRATCSTSCCCATPTSSCPTTRAVADGPARLRRRRPCRSAARGRPARRWPSTALVEPLIEALDARGLRPLNDDIEVPARAGAGPHGGRRRRRRRRRARRRSTTSLTPSATELTQADLGGRRRGVQRQLHPAAARDPVRQARPRAAEEDEDRLLHRRRVAREAARPAPDHRAPAALPRGREAALDLRRGPAGRGRGRRAHPRHVQPDRGPHRPAQLRRSPTCTTSRCAREQGRAFRKAFVPADGLRVPGRRLQPDRAALHRPPGRGPGARSRAFESGDGHPHRDRGADLRRRARRRSRSSSGRRRRWSPTASPTAWRPTASASGSTSRPTRPRSSSTPTSWRSRRCAPTWTATVAEARERGYTETLFGRRRQIPELQLVATSASARPGSARP